ncbi:streptophobe family protein [Streptomyces xylophagus]|uniref:streptophobe family protein n=1 Tax=Streptomyces xylophagus TaxID=285514 RepID=UPI001F1C2CFC|nr:streptophobe family protein [Streptomyces xylophagus]
MPVSTSTSTRSRPVSTPTPDGPGASALEGAAAALCGLVAMAAVAWLALWLMGAGSVGSPGTMAMALAAMAVGGSVSAGSAISAGGAGGSGSLGSMLSGLLGGGGGGMSPSMSGAADITPLGLTLVGSVVLWLVFSRRLRQRPVTVRELGARAAGAGAAALIAFVLVATLAHGTFSMPASAMSSGLGGGQSAGAGSGGGVLGGLFGGGSASQDTTMSYDVQVGSTAFGALVWVAVVLALGCLVSRRVRVPLGGAVDRVRPGWAPSLSAVVRTLLVLVAVPMALVTFVGVVVGGRAGTAAGGVLLLAPNALAVFLSLGVGSPWTAATHPVRSQGGNPLASLMGALGGGQQATPQQQDRTEHLRSLSAGGRPLWLAALAVTAVILLACAYAAARNTAPAHTLPPHRYDGPLARHLGMAERFGLVTAVVLGSAAWLAGASGNFGVSMFGSEMGGMRAELTGSVLWTVMFGLPAGGLAGFLAGLLRTADLYGGMTSLRRILARKSPLSVSPHAPAPGTDPGTLEAPLGNH